MRAKFLLLIASLALSLCPTGCSDDADGDSSAGTSIQSSSSKESVVIYEANPKVFATSDCLAAIEDRLDDIAALGADILWLMPTYTQGSKDAVGSPYCVRDYKSVNSEYGTEDDLASLVSSAHDMGMKVIMDWVANHTSWDHEWITDHPDWYTTDSSGNIISPSGTSWTDVADLDYSSSALRSAMIDAMLYWIDAVDIDGYRCDYAEGVPEDFWTTAIKTLRSDKDGLFMLAEGDDTGLYDCGFDAVYSWDFAYTAEDVFNGSDSMSDLISEHESDISGVPDDCYRMRYITNHDMASEESPVTAFGSEDAAFAGFVVTAMMSECVMIYSSQEVAYPSTLNFFTYNVMDWEGNASTIARYEEFMGVYVDTKSYREDGPTMYDTSDAASIYWENSSGQGLFVMVNTTSESLEARVPMARRGDKATDLLTGDSQTLGATYTLDAYEYKIWSIE